MNQFSLTLFDEKKKLMKTEEDSTGKLTAQEGGALEKTGDNKEASVAGKQEEKEESFEELIAGKYKEAFTKKVQEIINRRFKASKETEEKLKQLEAQMAAKETEKPNKETEGYVKALEQKIAAMQMQAQRSEAARKAKEAYDAWAQDMEGMQTEYPEFDLAGELNNPDYARLLKNGMGLKDAYEALHLSEIKEKIAQKAREEAENSYRQRQERPEENGAVGGAPLRLSRDVSRLSKEERREIARRAARGEKIKF